MTGRALQAMMAAFAFLTAAAAAAALGGGRVGRRRVLGRLGQPAAPGPSNRSGAGRGADRAGAAGTEAREAAAALPEALRRAADRLPVAGRLRRRSLAARFDAAMPETADLLVVCLQAGLNVPLALRRVGVHAPEPVRAGLERVNAEIDLGRPVREALGGFARRTGSGDVRMLVSILTGADRFGSRVSESLEGWADDLWSRRRHRVEAEARRAPVKILFPLVFLILPAFLLTTVVPLLLSTLRSLGY